MVVIAASVQMVEARAAAGRRALVTMGPEKWAGLAGLVAREVLALHARIAWLRIPGPRCLPDWGGY